MAGKTLRDEFLEQAPMQSVGIQPGLVHRRVLGRAQRVLEHVDRADQHERPAAEGVEMRDQALDAAAVLFGLAVGQPLLGGRGAAHGQIEFPAVHFGYGGRGVAAVERPLPQQGRSHEAGVSNQCGRHAPSPVRRSITRPMNVATRATSR